MRVQIDATKCSGYGVCANICPSLFQIDEFGFAAVIGDGAVAPGQESAVVEAARKCAEHAIKIVDEPSKQ